MNQSFHLYQLQKVDTQIDRCRQRTAEIDPLLAEDSAVRAARQRAEETGAILQEHRRELKQLEQARASRQMKKEQSESTLYGGKVKNPKELQDLQNEVASLAKAIAQLEDQALEVMLKIDEADLENQQAIAALEEATARAVQHHAGLLGERRQLQSNLDRLAREREVLAAQIQPETYQLYERLRKVKRGTAVAYVSDGGCESCGAELTPAEVQAARSPSRMVNCPSCGRILYAG